MPLRTFTTTPIVSSNPERLLLLLLLGSIVLSSCAFQSTPPSHIISTRPSTFLHSTTTDISNDTLLRWLLASGAPPDLHSVRIDSNQDGLRGLYANRDIGKNEIIFEIPYELALETGDTLKDGEFGKYLIGGDFDDVDCEKWDKETIYDVYQGLILLKRMEEDEDWIWDPYICNFPQEPESCDEAGLTPDFWSDELIKDLEIPSFVQEIMQRKQIIELVAEKNDVDEDELRWATWMIRSRRFTTWDMVDDPLAENESLMDKIIPKKIEQIRGFLLPLIDMVNHAHEPNAEMKITVNKWTKKFDETSSFALRALKPISKDEELTIRYGDGDWTCLQMMDKYGFFLEGSTADQEFDWNNDLKPVFSTSLRDDEKEKKQLLEDSEDKNGSRIDMLSLRIFLKQSMA